MPKRERIVDLCAASGKGITREFNVIHMRVAVLKAPGYGKAEVILDQGRISMKNRIVGRDLLRGQGPSPGSGDLPAQAPG
jgi:hypothetical protein